MKKYTISELQQQRESKDRVEFKKGENGNVSYNGAKADKHQKRRLTVYSLGDAAPSHHSDLPSA